MTIHIRLYQPADAGEIAEMVASILGEYQISVDREHIIADIMEADRRYAGDKAAFWVATADERVAGCIALRPMDEKVGELKRFYVRPEYRRQGLGQRLHDLLEQFAKQAGYEKIWLESSRRFADAQRFYRRNGYRFVEALDNDWEDNIYEKDLIGASSPVRIQPLSSDLITGAAEAVAACPIFAPYNFTPQRVSSIFAKALASGAEILIAAHQDRVVGVIWLQRKAMFGMSGYIKLVAVHPYAQGMGVGRTLLIEAEKRLTQDNPNVFLLTTADNQAAQAFYARMGYQAIGTVTSYVIPGVDEIIMRKTVTSLQASAPRAQ
ncbi:MAG: GNAT family N-acetyltransferase [Bacillota bacterium]